VEKYILHCIKCVEVLGRVDIATGQTQNYLCRLKSGWVQKEREESECGLAVERWAEVKVAPSDYELLS